MEVSCLSSGAGQKRGCPARPRAWTGRTTPSGPSMGCMASDGPPPAPIKASPRPPGPVPSNPPSRQLAGTADLTGPLCAGSRKSASLGFDAGRRRPQAKLGDGGGVPGIYMLWAPRRALPRAHPPPDRPGAAPPSPRTPAPNKIGIRPTEVWMPQPAAEGGGVSGGSPRPGAPQRRGESRLRELELSFLPKSGFRWRYKITRAATPATQ